MDRKDLKANRVVLGPQGPQVAKGNKARQDLKASRRARRSWLGYSCGNPNLHVVRQETPVTLRTIATCR